MGPLLFLLYINDLPRNITSQVRLFVDDCPVYHLIKTLSDGTVLQQDLDRLCSWATTWGMTFSFIPSKNYAYVMSIDSRKTTTLNFYPMLGQVLTKLTNITYLGVVLTTVTKKNISQLDQSLI